MNMDTLKAILAEAKGKARTCYMHQIGEPLLHPFINSMIAEVEAAGIKTSISTNAMLLNADMVQNLFNAGLTELTLALDSLDPSTYGRLRVNGHHELVMRNIDACLEYAAHHAQQWSFLEPPEIEVQVIVTKDNVYEIPAIEAKYKPMIARIPGARLRIKGFSTFAGHVPDMSPEPTQPMRFTCTKLMTHLAIHWNGDMSLCCRDYDGVQVLGNIHKQSIESVWTGDRMKALRLAHQKHQFGAYPELKFCEGC